MEKKSLKGLTRVDPLQLYGHMTMKFKPITIAAYLDALAIESSKVELLSVEERKGLLNLVKNVITTCDNADFTDRL